MPARSALVAVLLLAACAAPPGPPGAPDDTAPARPADAERPEWGRAFEAVGGRGTFVLYHPATGQTERFDAARAAARFLPASTFKLYNALVALDAGAVRDVDSVYVWDGVERSIPAWNRDHTLRTGMAASTVWLYQRVAERVGRERYRAGFAREPYGNGVVGDTLTQFWLDGSLRISADEQVRFVDRLRTGRTAFADDAEAAVRGIVPVLVERPGGAAGAPVRLLGKTGWGGEGPTEIGWLVGWVEQPGAEGGDPAGAGQAVVFALNVQARPGAAGFEMGPARLRIAEAILTAEGLLPAPASR